MQYCRLRVGDFSVRTQVTLGAPCVHAPACCSLCSLLQVIKHSLKPTWNETFSLPASAVQQALSSKQPLVCLEVWGQKQLGKPGLLGQVSMRSPQPGAVLSCCSGLAMPLLPVLECGHVCSKFCPAMS